MGKKITNISNIEKGNADVKTEIITLKGDENSLKLSANSVLFVQSK